MANFTWSGTWVTNTYYEVNTFVKYENIAYVSTNSFQGSTTPPPQDMSNWNVFIVGYQDVTPTPTPTIPETPTPTPSVTTTVTNTPSHTPVGSPTNTPSVTETPTPTVTETPTSTVTVTPTETETPTPTPTITQTPTITETPTSTPTPTSTTAVGSLFEMVLFESGSDVVMSGTGQFNLTDLVYRQTGNFTGFIIPNTASLSSGTSNLTPTPVDLYTGSTLTFPPNFGVSGITNANSGSGNMVSVIKQGPTYNLVVPSGYTSNTTLTTQSTFTGKTLSSLGVTVGTYTYTWGSGINTGTLTFEVIGTPPTPTPTPTITVTPTETETPTPTPTITQTPTSTPTELVLINPILAGVDEYIEVGINEYLMFT